MSLLSHIKSEDITKAIKKIDKEGIPDDQKWSKYRLFFEGKEYPFKHLVREASLLSDVGISLAGEDAGFGSNTSTRGQIEKLDPAFRILYYEDGKTPYNTLEAWKQVLQPYINQYKSFIHSPDYYELYKWEAFQTFNLNWDINAEDFTSMYDQSFKPDGCNLWSGSRYNPKKAVLHWCTLDPEDVRLMFKELFDETKELSVRIDNFKNKADEINEELNPGKNYSSHHDVRAIMLYLALRFPHKYYLYKYRMYENFCTKSSLLPKPKNANAGTRHVVTNYLNTCEKLNNILSSDQDLIKLHLSLRNENHFEDTYGTLLTQDFIYVLSEGYLDATEKIYTKELSMSLKNNTSLNTILFGPPGTGKTYLTKNKAVQIIEDLSDQELEQKYPERELLNDRFSHYVQEGQIDFVTFHQSFSYEDFIEGIKPQLSGLEEEDEANDLSYHIKDGVFKRIAERADSYANYDNELVKPSDSNPASVNYEDAHYFKISLGNSRLSEDDEIYEYCIENDCIALGWGGEINYEKAEDETAIRKLLNENKGEYSSYEVVAVKCFRHWMEDRDGTKGIVFVSNGNSTVRSVAQIIGPYEYRQNSPIRFRHFRKVKWLYKDINVPIRELYNKNLSQQTVYEMSSSKIKTGFFLDTTSKTKEKKNHVLIIDEINRGNVANIFGELITLIEEDKRFGAQEGLELILPYSKKKFSVPPNLYLIGTMNTADRSVEALDSALRRRFSFYPCYPDPTLLSDFNKTILDLDIEQMLKTINNRIEKLLNQDYTIGHAYFWTLKESTNPLEKLQLIFKNKLIPLLQEYFYGDYEKIGMVLGKSFVQAKEYEEAQIKFANGFSNLYEYEDKEIFEITNASSWDWRAFRSIYTHEE